MAAPHRYVDQAREFVRSYTDGLNVEDLRKLFDQDVSKAYKVLAQDRRLTDEPEEDLHRLLYRAKVVFLGVSEKLTPARRTIFAACILLTLIGLFNPVNFNIALRSARFSVDFSALWFTTAIAGLLYLLIVELVDRVRVRDELEVARHLQRDLLPQSAPPVPGYEFAHSYRTANEVGGDYHDFQLLDDGRIALMVGDASGHGIAAGLLMAIANATLKTAIDLDPSPVQVAAVLNRALYRTGDRRAFMTLFYAVLEPATGEVEYVCAGHPFPLVRHPDGNVEELGTGSLPLGLRPEIALESATTRLGVGDLLALYTDGLVEAVDGDDQAFGFERLKALLREPAGPYTLHDRILASFDRHVDKEPLTDDLTLVVMAATPPPPAV